MRHEEMISIATTTDSNHANLLKLELQNVGIHCELEGEQQGGFAGVFEIRILVPAVNADEAIRFLENHKASTGTSASINDDARVKMQHDPNAKITPYSRRTI